MTAKAARRSRDRSDFTKRFDDISGSTTRRLQPFLRADCPRHHRTFLKCRADCGTAGRGISSSRDRERPIRSRAQSRAPRDTHPELGCQSAGGMRAGLGICASGRTPAATKLPRAGPERHRRRPPQPPRNWGNDSGVRQNARHSAQNEFGDTERLATCDGTVQPLPPAVVMGRVFPKCADQDVSVGTLNSSVRRGTRCPSGPRRAVFPDRETLESGERPRRSPPSPSGSHAAPVPPLPSRTSGRVPHGTWPRPATRH